MPAERRVEVAVGAVIVRDGSILLVERGRGVQAKHWSVPGGRVHAGETLVDAVRREVVEETGLTVTVDRFLGWVERIGDDPAPYHFVILDFAAHLDGPIATPVASDDAADVAWVPLDALNTVKLVPGLADFLVEVGVIATGVQRHSHEQR